MKRIISIILAALMLTTALTYAATATEENADGGIPERTVSDVPEFDDGGKLMYFAQSDGTYAVTSRDKDMIKQTLDIPAEFNGRPVTVIQRNSFFNCDITEVILHEGLEVIEEYAFNCCNLESVTVPDSVIYIGENAFSCFPLKRIHIGENCRSLNSSFGSTALSHITVSDKNETYIGKNDCLIEKATGVLLLGSENSVIPDDVTYIGDGAFSGCRGLTSVTVPENVTGIGSYAFSLCSGLKTVTMPESVKTVGSYAFVHSGLEEVVINTADCEFSSNAFSGLPLTSIVIGDGVKKINAFMFKNCQKLTEIEIPGSVEKIEEGAFYGCCNVKNLKFNEGLIEIGEKAFYGMTLVNETVLPDSLKIIGPQAFSQNLVQGGLNNWSTKRIVLGKGLEYIGDGAFRESITVTDIEVNCDKLEYLGKGAFTNCRNVKSFDVPEGLKVISASAFAGCDSLEKIVIPDSVEIIESCAFQASDNLKEVVFGKNVRIIGDQAFNYCISLNKAILPHGLESIGRKAFNKCPLWELSVPDGVSFIGLNAFANTHVMYTDTDGAFYVGNENNPYAALIWMKDEHVKSFAVKDGVTLIAEGALERCEDIETVTIPESVTDINRFAFQEAENLKTVYFGGSEAQWCGIRIGDTFNDYLFKAKIIYGKETTVTRGDLNGDGSINNKDVVTLFRFVSGDPTIRALEGAADVNGDGAINNKDVTALFRELSN